MLSGRHLAYGGPVGVPGAQSAAQQHQHRTGNDQPPGYQLTRYKHGINSTEESPSWRPSLRMGTGLAKLVSITGQSRRPAGVSYCSRRCTNTVAVVSVTAAIISMGHTLLHTSAAGMDFKKEPCTMIRKCLSGLAWARYC